MNWKNSFYINNSYYKTELYENKPFDIIVTNGAKNVEGLELAIVVLNEYKFEIICEGTIKENNFKQKIDFEHQVYFNTNFDKDKYFDFTLRKKNCIVGKKYYMVFNNINALTRNYLKKVKITLEDKESELINVQIHSQTPKKDADFINELNQVFITAGIKKEQ